MYRKHKLGSSTIASEATEEVANSGQEMLDKPYIRFGDAAKFETYSKVRELFLSSLLCFKHETQM